MSALAFFGSALLPLRCLPSDLTNPFVVPGVFACIGWVDALMMAVAPIFAVHVLRRVTVGRFKPWLLPALRWLATALVALAAMLLVADGWIWLQALHFIPWCAPPGAFSDAARNAQFARLNVAGVLGFGGMLVGICLGALGGIVVMLLVAGGRSRHTDLGAAPAAHTAGPM